MPVRIKTDYKRIVDLRIAQLKSQGNVCVFSQLSRDVLVQLQSEPAPTLIDGLDFAVSEAPPTATPFMCDFWQDGPTQWQSADLGSDERKQKFLRLMGASKVSFHWSRRVYL